MGGSFFCDAQPLFDDMLGGVFGLGTKPMRRRQFITLLGGAAAAWPHAARGQERERRRIGVLLSPAADDLEYQSRIAAFQQALQQLGWTDAGNVRIDIRWGLGWDTELIRQNVAEMVALTPDVIVAIGSRIVGA